MVLPRFIESLMGKEAFPEPTSSVELIQTHISYVILTDTLAIKIKKPVDFGFLDFSTLSARLHFCKEELRLNKRLAPTLYLGLMRVVKEAQGSYVLRDGEAGGAGEEVVDYAVKMQRVEANSILSEKIKAGAVTDEEVKRVADVVAGFHLSLEPPSFKSTGEGAAPGSTETLKENTEENFTQVEPFIGRTISKESFDLLRGYTRSFFKENEPLLKEREAFVRDCHGDLRAEHVATAASGKADTRVEIFDCIEFNERFRISDTLLDAAFLAMDLDLLGRGDMSRAFMERYMEKAGIGKATGASLGLINFYKCYRAYVRGKVEGFKLDEEEESKGDKLQAAATAAHCFRVARLYAEGGYRPFLIIASGLPGTGKSSFAREVGKLTGAAVLDSDVIRKEIFGDEVRKAPKDSGAGVYMGGIYTKDKTERTYKELIRRAEVLLKAGRPVVISATFSRRAFLTEARERGSAAAAEVYTIRCVLDDVALRERFRERAEKGAGATDATWDVYKLMKESFETIEGPHLEVRTDKDPMETAANALTLIFREAI